nr:AFG1/ZapE family ATPase [Rhodococcus marinonascens]
MTASAIRERTIWFDFSLLCGTPTAPSDYLELSARFPRWVIHGVPRLRETDAETVRRFANVVDVLYDRGIPLTAVAEAPWEDVLVGLGNTPDFDRLVSRLSTLRRSA